MGALVGLLMLAGSLLTANIPMTGLGEGSGTVPAKREWSSERYTDGPSYELADTDGDGASELLVWAVLPGGGPKGTTGLFVHDLPGYKLASSARVPGEIRPDIRDLDGDGIPEIIVESFGSGRSNITIYSGDTLMVKWKSPDLCDIRGPYQVSDIDADGELELVWYGLYDNGSTPPGETATRIHAFGASSHREKMNLSGIDGRAAGFQLADLDADPAKEIVFLTAQMRKNQLASTRIRVVDGAAHEVQWETPDDPSVEIITQLQFADLDNDSTTEIVAAFMETDPVNGTAASVRVFSGNNGTLEWRHDVGTSILAIKIAETDGDAGRELLVRADSEVLVRPPEFHQVDTGSEVTLLVLDPGDIKEPWSAGPFLRPAQGSVELSASDLDGDGRAEVIVTNSTFGKDWSSSKAEYTVLDGKDSKVLWNSPQYGGKAAKLVGADQDNDEVFEFMVPDTRINENGQQIGRLHVVSAKNYSEEWTSGEFNGGVVDAGCARVVGDRRPELVISTLEDKPGTYIQFWQKFILDGETKETLWSSPRRPGVDFEAANLVDGPDSEVFCIGNIWKTAGSTTEMFLYGGSNFSELWSSGVLGDSLSIRAAGDLDSDGYGEVLTIIERDKDSQISDFQLVMWEFSLPLGSGPMPSGNDPTGPDETGSPAVTSQWGGVSSVLVMAVAATTASASTGVLAFVLVKRKNARSAQAAGSAGRVPVPPELGPGQDLELRK